jgi:hypothetical protein
MGQAMLIGAGVGALTSALRGENLLKGAAIGGATGGLTGGLGNYFKTGSLLGANAAGAEVAKQAMAQNLATGATSSAIPTTASAFEASMGLPNTALIEAGAPLASVMPTGAGMGLSFNPETGGYFNKDYYSNVLGNQVYTGGEGFLSNAIDKFTPSMEDLKKYATIDNLAGAAAISSQFKPTPISQAPQGRVTQGQIPQGGLGGGGVEGLLAELQKRQQQQYQPITLL